MRIYLAIICSFFLGSVLGQMTYVVNSTDDTDDGVCDGVHCSFREAINAINTTGSAGSVHFNIPGNGPHIIKPGSLDSQFPVITENIIIDATTQPSWTLGSIIIDGVSPYSNQYLNSNLYPLANGSYVNNFVKKIELYGLSIKNYSGGVALNAGIIGSTYKPNKFIDCYSSSIFIIPNSNQDIKIENNHFISQNFGGIYSEGEGNLIIKQNTFENLQYDALNASNYYGSHIFSNNKIINCGTGLGSGGVITSHDNKFINSGSGINPFGSDDISVPTVLYSQHDSFIMCNSGINISFPVPFDIKNNYFESNENGILIGTHEYAINHGSSSLKENQFYCNNYPINTDYSSSSSYTTYSVSIPNIISSTDLVIKGTADPNKKIDVYRTIETNCSTSICQGSSFLGTTIADSNGDWTLISLTALNVNDRLTAIGEGVYGVDDGFGFFTYYNIPSKFSDCFFVLPDVCHTAEEIAVNTYPCSTTGIVLNMNQMNSSSSTITSAALQSTYAGSDGWIKFTMSDSGNVLLRTNLDNAIQPVIETYKGSCDNLSFQGATAFDTISQAMVIQGQPGDQYYARIWDNGNQIVNGAGSSLLHLTAHELGSTIPSKWIICDEENSYATGNPTIISEKDANSFIIEYDPNISAAELSLQEDTLINLGLTKIDSCSCGNNPLQLWLADNPIEMETIRKSSIARANVDTANYNYHFEPLEFKVNSYTRGQQIDSDVAMDPEGNFVITWTDIQLRTNYGRVYNSSGNSIKSQITIGDDDTDNNIRENSTKVGMSSNGDFTAVWSQQSPAYQGYRIYGRKYDVIGVPLSINPISISSSSANTSGSDLKKSLGTNGYNPDIDVNDTGNFVIGWHNIEHLFIQRYDQNFILQDSIIQIGINSDNSAQPSPSVAINDNDEIIIVWVTKDNDEYGIYGQRINSMGVKQGSEFLINSYETDQQINPKVVLKNDGSFIVTWQSHEQINNASGFDIYARIFDANGNPVSSEFLVNSYTSDDQQNPDINLLNDGRFFIAWDSYGQDGYEEGVFGQLFDPTGSPIFNEEPINSIIDPEQLNPSVSSNGSNLLISSWVSGSKDNSFEDIYGQRLEIGNNKLTKIGTTTPSFLLGVDKPYSPVVYSSTDSVSNVRVAIIDTGVDPSHPFLKNTIWNNQQIAGAGCISNDLIGFDYYNNSSNPIDLDGHGTKVNGIIAQDFDPDVQLEVMNLKFHQGGIGKVFDAICAIYYAVENGATVINLSWGFEASEPPSIFRKALEFAEANDVIVVTTAGNTSKNNDNIKKYPANFSLDNMIVVSSFEEKADGSKRMANYASYGANTVDITAPGFVETTDLGNTLSISAGTSLAAPFVTRTAATIRGLYPVLTAMDVKECILNSAQANANMSNFVSTGGILDHNAALACARDKAMDCMGIDLFITVNQSIDTTYRSDAWVNSDATVANNSDVKMYGAEYVGLKPDFEVELGAEYLADIDDCAPNNEPMDFISSNDDQPSFSIAAHSPHTGKIKTKFYSDGIHPVTIDLRTAQGTSLHHWESGILKKGWYEKIIDVAKVKSGHYEIAFEGANYQTRKQLLLRKERLNKR